MDRQIVGPWIGGDTLSRADIIGVCGYDFVPKANPHLFATFNCPNLDALSQRSNELEVFRSTAP